MGEGFNRFKKKFRRGALLKSIAYGLSLGVAVVAALMLIQKLTLIHISPLVYALAGGLSALLLGVLLSVCLIPNDRRLAKMLDRRLDMNEKVQTMVSFCDETGSMVELQRQDTDERLLAIPLKSVRIKRKALSMLSLLLAAAMLTAALLVPTLPTAAEEEPLVDEYEQNWRAASIAELIALVEKSLMQETPKAETLTALGALLDTVKTTDKENEMKTAAIVAVLSIDEAISKANVALPMAERLKTSADGDIKAMADAMSELGATAFRKALESFRERLEGEDASEIAYTFNEEIGAAIRTSGIDADNAFAKRIDGFSKTLLSIANAEPVVQEDIDALFDEARPELQELIMQQRDNMLTGATVVSKLMDIFGLIDGDLVTEGEEPPVTAAPEQFIPPEEDDDEEDEEELGDGGYGSGEFVVGSDDTVYDAADGAYVPYGKVIIEYYARMSALLQSKELTPEQKKMVNDYFAALLDGSRKDS